MCSDSVTRLYRPGIAGLFGAGLMLAPLIIAAGNAPAAPDEIGVLLAQGLERASKEPGYVVELPPGEHLVRAGGDYHLVIEEASHVTVRGKGTTLIFQDPLKGGILIEGSDHVLLQGVTMKWSVPPYIQGRILKADGKRYEVAVDGPFTGTRALPYGSAERIWLTLADPDGARYGALGSRVIDVTDVAWTAADRVILTIGGGARNIPPSSLKGLRVCVTPRFTGSHAVTVHDSSDVTISGVEILASPGMGVLVHDNPRNIRLEGIRIMPDKTTGALVSTNADGLHVINPAGQVTIANNTLIATQDDAIAVGMRGAWAQVVPGKDGVAVDLEGRLDGVRKNVALDWLVPGKGVRRAGAVSDVAKNGKVRRVAIAPGPSTDSRPPDRTAVFVVEGDEADVLIEGNLIEGARSRGIRVSHPGVRITGNRLSGVMGPSILLAAYLGDKWVPQAPASGAEVRDNTIELAAGDVAPDSAAGIAVYPLPSGCTYCSLGATSKLVVADNRFARKAGALRCEYFLSDVSDSTLPPIDAANIWKGRKTEPCQIALLGGSVR